MLKLLERMGRADLTRADLTVHGFRSTFRDWAAEAGVSREIAEACLAHATGNAVERAYLRTKFLEQRRAVSKRGSPLLDALIVMDDEHGPAGPQHAQHEQGKEGERERMRLSLPPLAPSLRPAAI